MTYEEYKARYQDSISPKDAEFALFAQSACNASGLIHNLSKKVTELWNYAREKGLGTDWVNEHPILMMFITQLVWLNAKCGVDSARYSFAYNLCTEILAEAKAKKEAVS